MTVNVDSVFVALNIFGVSWTIARNILKGI